MESFSAASSRSADLLPVLEEEYRGALLNTPAGELDADRMTVEYDRGNNDEVLVFKSGGRRTIKRVRLAMTLSTPSPAISASASWSSYVEEIPEQQERERLLSIYDHFTKRSFLG